MRMTRYCILTLLFCLPLRAQTTPDVGSGSPTDAIQASFVNAFYRNGFANLVSLPPLADVKKLGTQGLFQEFADAAKNQTDKYALVMPNTAAPVTQNGVNVVQMYPALYSYYTSLGSTTAGYPISDTFSCPALVSIPGNSCQYQILDKPYLLFVYSAAINSVATFATRNPFYTKWQNLGGISSLGPTISAEVTATSTGGTTGVIQAFDKGAIVSLTSGVLNGRVLAIGSVIYPLYAANNTYAGFLGFPTADEITLASGVHRQTFEGGAIEYVPGSDPTLRYPVANVAVVPGASLKLSAGDTRTLQATLTDPNGAPLTDRTVSWTTSNQRVVSIQTSGYTATITAVAGGTAIITATSESKSSTPLTVVVVAACCAIGEGAPTPAIQQAFVDAVTRNRLTLQLPAAAPVTRSGSGYVQDFQDANNVDYLVAVSDRALNGFVVSGALLAQYLVLGGPTGSLGYPSSDATAGGRQLFENQTALAGSPPQLVAGIFLTKWAGLGYETGALGSPTSGATQVLTFRASLGQMQSFAKGVMFSALTGPQARQVYFVTGLTLAAYNQAGAASGQLGLPVDNEFTLSGTRRQDFDGGYIDYAPADAAAVVHLSARIPLVSATPSTIIAGGRVRLGVGGFNDTATLKVSITGQPDFIVQTTNGAYSWETIVPATAKSGVVQIHAADTASSSTANGSYSIRAITDVVLQVSKISGDSQTGLPGALLTQPLTVTVRDDSQNPVPGVAVAFNASPGGQISATAVTDANGQAQASWRLPPVDGIALATAQAGRQVVTFSAQALHSSLNAFPAMTQSSSDLLGNGSDTIAQKGALLVSTAAILRYYQNRGDLPSAGGFADPQVLNQFLKGLCTPDAQGAQICDGFLTPTGSQEQIVNLWRAGAFTGAALTVSVEQPTVVAVRDFVAQGYPVLLALALKSQGGHYVVATGVAADGGITIMDPSPTFARTALNDYLANSAILAGAVRLIPRAPAAPGFLVAGDPVFDILSPAGPCGTNLDLPTSTAPIRLRFCDGAAGQYELDVTAGGAFSIALTDLGSPGARNILSGSGTTAYGILRTGAQWSASPQQLSFTVQGVVNSASFTPGIAPGGLFAVFGSGLARTNSSTSVELGGIAVNVVAQSPFQLNAQVPPGLAPGAYPLKITSPYGSMEQTVTINDVAPAIFEVSPQSAAILNQNSTLNTPDNPAPRGSVVVVYCTGLGDVVKQGNFQVASHPVTVLLGGGGIVPIYAGLTPGFFGLYQVNVPIPISIPPGIGLSLAIQQANTTSKAVPVTIQ